MYNRAQRAGLQYREQGDREMSSLVYCFSFQCPVPWWRRLVSKSETAAYSPSRQICAKGQSYVNPKTAWTQIQNLWQVKLLSYMYFDLVFFFRGLPAVHLSHSARSDERCLTCHSLGIPTMHRRNAFTHNRNLISKAFISDKLLKFFVYV